MNKTFIIIATIAVVAFTNCGTKKCVSPESWSGEVAIGANKLKMGFNIKNLPDGKQSCTMDVPQQGAKDIPVEITRNDSDSLNLFISTLKAVYKGRKVSPESIEGTFTQHGAVFSLSLKPGAVSERPQTPVPPFAYKTEEVIFKNEAESAELSGTLTYPVNYKKLKRGSVPVVLMVTGSGSQDRNEEIFGHKPFLVIADFLARNGVASLRYDDRSTGGSKGPTKNITTMNNLADAKAGISYLRSLDKFGKIGVLGHSEGGTIAFMMGAEKSVDFIVSLAGTAANGIDVIVGQNKALMQLQGTPQKLAKDYTSALRIVYNDRINKKDIKDKQLYVNELCKSNNFSLPESLKSNLEKCITFGDEWLTWFLAYSPVEAIRKITCPVMALNGNMDMQVLSNDNLTLIKENLPANDKNLIKEYASLNHMFQHCTPATALNYSAIEETISEEVLRDIINWIDCLK